jgi:hypothetical protein
MNSGPLVSHDISAGSMPMSKLNSHAVYRAGKARKSLGIFRHFGKFWSEAEPEYH